MFDEVLWWNRGVYRETGSDKRENRNSMMLRRKRVNWSRGERLEEEEFPLFWPIMCGKQFTSRLSILSALLFRLTSPSPLHFAYFSPLFRFVFLLCTHVCMFYFDWFSTSADPVLSSLTLLHYALPHPPPMHSCSPPHFLAVPYDARSSPLHNLWRHPCFLSFIFFFRYVNFLDKGREKEFFILLLGIAKKFLQQVNKKCPFRKNETKRQNNFCSLF